MPTEMKNEETLDKRQRKQKEKDLDEYFKYLDKKQKAFDKAKDAKAKTKANDMFKDELDALEKRLELSRKSVEEIEKLKDEWQKKRDEESEERAKKLTSNVVSTTKELVNDARTLYESGANMFLEIRDAMAYGLDGTGKSISNVADKIDAAAANGSAKVSAIYSNLSSLVKSGIVNNVEQRAYLQTLAEDIGMQFSVSSASLNRLIEIFGEDISAQKMALEGSLKEMLNEYYNTSRYIQEGFTQVADAIVESQALMKSSTAIEYESTMQQILGGLNSIGLSTATVTSLAGAINSLLTGDVDSIVSSNVQKLLIMGASKSNVDYTALLTEGVGNDVSQVVKLMDGVIDYLKEISEEDNLVIKNRLADIFGVTVSDLAAIKNNLSSSELADLDGNLKNVEQMNNVSKLLEKIGSEYTSVSTRTSNILENLFYGMGVKNASNETYTAYLLSTTIANLTADLISGINFNLVADLDLSDIVKDIPFALTLGANAISALHSSTNTLKEIGSTYTESFNLLADTVKDNFTLEELGDKGVKIIPTEIGTNDEDNAKNSGIFEQFKKVETDVIEQVTGKSYEDTMLYKVEQIFGAVGNVFKTVKSWFKSWAGDEDKEDPYAKDLVTYTEDNFTSEDNKWTAASVVTGGLYYDDKDITSVSFKDDVLTILRSKTGDGEQYGADSKLVQALKEYGITEQLYSGGEVWVKDESGRESLYNHTIGGTSIEGEIFESIFGFTAAEFQKSLEEAEYKTNHTIGILPKILQIPEEADTSISEALSSVSGSVYDMCSNFLNMEDAIQDAAGSYVRSINNSFVSAYADNKLTSDEISDIVSTGVEQLKNMYAEAMNQENAKTKEEILSVRNELGELLKEFAKQGNYALAADSSILESIDSLYQQSTSIAPYTGDAYDYIYDINELFVDAYRDNKLTSDEIDSIISTGVKQLVGLYEEAATLDDDYRNNVIDIANGISDVLTNFAESTASAIDLSSVTDAASFTTLSDEISAAINNANNAYVNLQAGIASGEFGTRNESAGWIVQTLGDLMSVVEDASSSFSDNVLTSNERALLENKLKGIDLAGVSALILSTSQQVGTEQSSTTQGSSPSVSTSASGNIAQATIDTLQATLNKIASVLGLININVTDSKLPVNTSVSNAGNTGL